MEISKNNFWIRLNEEFYENKPKSLCGLFWKSVIAFICVFTNPLQYVLFAIAFVSSKVDKLEEFSITSSVSSGLFVMNLLVSFASFAMINTNFITGNFTLAYLTVIITLVILGAIIWCLDWLNDKIVDWRFNRRISREGLDFPPLPKEPSIIVESFKAIKSKVCPVITYKD